MFSRCSLSVFSAPSLSIAVSWLCSNPRDPAPKRFAVVEPPGIRVSTVLVLGSSPVSTIWGEKPLSTSSSSPPSLVDSNDELATKVNEQVAVAGEICAMQKQGELIEGLVSVYPAEPFT